METASEDTASFMTQMFWSDTVARLNYELKLT